MTLSQAFQDFIADHRNANGTFHSGVDWMNAVLDSTPANEKIWYEFADNQLGGYPALVMENPNMPQGQRAYGGFFPPVTPENYREAAALLPEEGQWFLNYLQTGAQPAGNSAAVVQQQAFLSAYDSWMAGMLDARLGARTDAIRLRASDFGNSARDQTYTASEHAELLNSARFPTLIGQMGELSMPFILLTGGIVQGAIDIEVLNPLTPDGRPSSIPDRYNLQELRPFYSARALNLLDGYNSDEPVVSWELDENLKRGMNRIDALLGASITNMELVCGTVAPTPNPTPSQPRPVFTRGL